ncbi:hypothetical protein ACJX0J_024778, partial [Zea mays]
AGHYQKPEDVPFFPQDLPSPLFPTKPSPKVLHPFASLVTVNDAIWKMYFDELLPLFTVDGDDGSYAQTVALDLACLQVLSQRIHIGKYVAEVKFKDAPQEYSRLIKEKQYKKCLGTNSLVQKRIMYTHMIYALVLRHQIITNAGKMDLWAIIIAYEAVGNNHILKTRTFWLIMLLFWDLKYHLNVFF